MISLQDFMQTKTAGELMTLAPIGVRADESVQQAVKILADEGISAMAVTDRTGRPIGVLSQRDVLRYDREMSEFIAPLLEYYQTTDLERYSGDIPFQGILQNKSDMIAVREIMNAEVYAVKDSASVQAVIDAMLDAKVHRLFVTDATGLLIGVVSMADILGAMLEAVRL